MVDKTQARRSTVPRLFLGAALVGTAVLASCNVASANQLVSPRDPEVTRVNGQRPIAVQDGLQVFQTDDWNVGISVDAADGRLVVSDQATGDVICEVPHYTYPGLGGCPGFIGPGEHRLVAAVTTNGKTRTSQPVVLESYAEDMPDDGAAPSPIVVHGTAPGDRAGSTAVTFRGAPGDRWVLRDADEWEIGRGTVDDTGRFTAQVLTGNDTVRVHAESQRSGERRISELDVVGDPKPGVQAEALQLVDTVRDADGTEIVVRGTPGARYQMHQVDSSNRTVGTVPADGRITWRLTGPKDEAVDVDWWTGGDDGGHLSGTFTVASPADPGVGEPDPGEGDPGTGEPGEPAEPVATPHPGTVDPGFALPVVAEPNPGPVDPAFSAREEQGLDEVTLESTAPSRLPDTTTVTVHGTANAFVLVHSDDRPFTWTGRLDASGRATFDVHDFITGEKRTFSTEASLDGKRSTSRFDVEGNSRPRVHAEPLELVDTEHDGTRTEIVVRGTPGATYDLHRHSSTERTHGTVPADGLVRWTLDIAADSTVGVSWETSGDDVEDHRTGTFRVTGPTTPVVAEPAPGETDPGFTAPGAAEPTPVVAEPAPGGTDPGFTAPVVAEPAPGATDPGFTAPGGDGDDGGDGDEQPHREPTVEVTSVNPLAQQGVVRVQDPTTDRTGYTASVVIDGNVRGSVRITNEAAERTLDHFGGVGEHTLELKEKGEVVASVRYRVPPLTGDDDVAPGDRQVTAELSAVLPQRAILRVQDPTAGPFWYTAQVYRDGRLIDALRITTKPTEHVLQDLGGSGDHVLELKVHGETVKRIDYTIPQR